MSTVANFLAKTPQIMKVELMPKQEMEITHFRRNNPTKRQEDMTDDEFVEHMKENPQLWGINHCGNNAYPMRKGYVMIYDRGGAFCKSIFFSTIKQKNEVITQAMKSIKNLNGCYIEITYA